MHEEPSEIVNHRSVFKTSMKPKIPQFVCSLSTASLLVHHLREGWLQYWHLYICGKLESAQLLQWLSWSVGYPALLDLRAYAWKERATSQFGSSGCFQMILYVLKKIPLKSLAHTFSIQFCNSRLVSSRTTSVLVPFDISSLLTLAQGIFRNAISNEPLNPKTTGQWCTDDVVPPLLKPPWHRRTSGMEWAVWRSGVYWYPPILRWNLCFRNYFLEGNKPVQ